MLHSYVGRRIWDPAGKKYSDTSLQTTKCTLEQYSIISFGSSLPLKVPAPGVLCGWKGTTQNLQQGGCVVCGSHFLPMFVWPQGKSQEKKQF